MRAMLSHLLLALPPTSISVPALLHLGLQADLWSIGTILYELLVGKPPFTGANHMQLLRNIERGEARLPEAVGARLSPACRGLLGRLLQRNPVERLSFEEFFTHPFLSGSTGAAHCICGVELPHAGVMGGVG